MCAPRHRGPACYYVVIPRHYCFGAAVICFATVFLPLLLLLLLSLLLLLVGDPLANAVAAVVTVVVVVVGTH